MPTAKQEDLLILLHLRRLPSLSQSAPGFSNPVGFLEQNICQFLLAGTVWGFNLQEVGIQKAQLDGLAFAVNDLDLKGCSFCSLIV